jgi:hypothetical protein
MDFPSVLLQLLLLHVDISIRLLLKPSNRSAWPAGGLWK